jgi:hypothetical protein
VIAALGCLFEEKEAPGDKGAGWPQQYQLIAAGSAKLAEDRDYSLLRSVSGRSPNILIQNKLNAAALRQSSKCDLSHCRVGFFLT